MKVAEYRTLTAPSESEIQCRYFAILEANEAKHPVLKWIHASMNGASATSAAAAALRKRQGQKRGVWDVCIPVPQTMDECPGAWIEFKTAKNKLTSEQEQFRDHLVANGYEFAVCRSVDAALEFTEEYFGITLSR